MSRDNPSTSYEHPGFWRDCIEKENRIRHEWNKTYGEQIYEARRNNQLRRGQTTPNQQVISESREDHHNKIVSLTKDKTKDSQSILAPSRQMVTPRMDNKQESQYGRRIYETGRYIAPYGKWPAENNLAECKSSRIPSSQTVLLRNDHMQSTQRLSAPSGQMASPRKHHWPESQTHETPRYNEDIRRRAAINQQIKSESQEVPANPSVLSSVGQKHEMQRVSAPEFYRGPESGHQVAVGKCTGFDRSRPGSSTQPVEPNVETSPYSGYGKVIKQKTENRNVLQYRKPIAFTKLTSLEDQVPFQQQIRPGVDPDDWRPHFHRQHIPTCKKCYIYPCECANFKTSGYIPIRSYGPAENLPDWDHDHPEKNPKIRDMGEYGTCRLRNRLNQTPQGLTNLGRSWYYGIRAGNTGENHSGWNPRLCLLCEGREEEQRKLGNDLVDKGVEFPRFFYIPEERRKGF